MRRIWIIGLVGILLAAGMLYAIQRAGRYADRIQGPPAICDGTASKAYNELRYADAPDSVLDLYVPVTTGACPAKPLAVWVHGGGFTSGDKAISDAKVRLLAKEGWAVASVGYRLAGPQRPVRIPDQATDIATALSWLQANKRTYGINPQRIMLIGFSAGAYLVSAVSTNPEYLAAHGIMPQQIVCTASLDTGAYDLPQYMASADSAVPLYASVIPEPQQYAAFSPVTYVRQGRYAPAMLLVTRGEGIRPELTAAFAQRLKAAGRPAIVLQATGYTHGDLDTNLGLTSDKLLTTTVRGFARNCAKIR